MRANKVLEIRDTHLPQLTWQIEERIHNNDARFIVLKKLVRIQRNDFAP